jgi:hypothetical protein
LLWLQRIRRKISYILLPRETLFLKNLEIAFGFYSWSKDGPRINFSFPRYIDPTYGSEIDSRYSLASANPIPEVREGLGFAVGNKVTFGLGKSSDSF